MKEVARKIGYGYVCSAMMEKKVTLELSVMEIAAITAVLDATPHKEIANVLRNSNALRAYDENVKLVLADKYKSPVSDVVLNKDAWMDLLYRHMNTLELINP